MMSVGKYLEVGPSGKKVGKYSMEVSSQLLASSSSSSLTATLVLQR